jgi:putative tryptophan/tyrosine transport system substrate-binding protein
MRRREFIAGLGSAVAWPLAARAQQGERVRRVGVLMGLAEDAPDARVRLATFRQTLERLGWSEDRNVRIDYRYSPATSAEEAQGLAKGLVGLRPDVIVAQSNAMTWAVQRATRTIPIVFAGVVDPIAAGFVASMARPGGNVTGLITFEDTILGKWLAMLKEISPSLEHAALVDNPKTNPLRYWMSTAKAVAQSLGIKIVPTPVETAQDIEREIESFSRVPNSGLVFPPDITTPLYRDLTIALTARYRLPAVYSDRTWIVSGGLMCYAVDRDDEYRTVASYVDRILRGETPANLPVQAPTKYITVLNLKTAKALGLTVPDLLLVRADEVIE